MGFLPKRLPLGGGTIVPRGNDVSTGESCTQQTLGVVSGRGESIRM